MEMERYQSKIDISPATLKDDDVSDLVAFMHALTGDTAQNLRFGVPDTVPSGLTVDK